MYICVRTHVPHYTYLWTSCAAMFWMIRIYQIQGNQNKARKTPLSICPVYHPPERHIPSARAQYGKTFLATRARLFRSAVQRYNIFLIYTRVNCIFFEFSSKGHKKTDRCPLFTLSLLTVDVLRQWVTKGYFVLSRFWICSTSSYAVGFNASKSSHVTS